MAEFRGRVRSLRGQHPSEWDILPSSISSLIDREFAQEHADQLDAFADEKTRYNLALALRIVRVGQVVKIHDRQAIFRRGRFIRAFYRDLPRLEHKQQKCNGHYSDRGDQNFKYGTAFLLLLPGVYGRVIR